MMICVSSIKEQSTIIPPNKGGQRGVSALSRGVRRSWEGFTSPCSLRSLLTFLKGTTPLNLSAHRRKTLSCPNFELLKQINTESKWSFHLKQQKYG